MAAVVNPTPFFSLVSAILILSNLCLNEAQTTSFTVELIHRDSPKSPFYNPMETTYGRVTNAVRRSFSRVRRFKPTSRLVEGAKSGITVGSGEYLMNISIGTPAFEIVAVADTGSDLVWTQCKPCSKCFKQEAPIFDPGQSSTYKPISCDASQCQSFTQTRCSTNNTCQYSVLYADNTYSIGDVAVDTITLASTTGSPVSFPNTAIGCGHDNYQDTDGKNSGVIGLGGDEFSLISQMGSSIAGKFSYCLLPITETTKSSEMNFGSSALVSGPGVVSTPLIKLASLPSFYYLHLEAVSVGTKRINYADVSLGKPDTKGNIIIDSGTTLTLLPSGIHSKLESAVASQINATRVHVPEITSLCYDAKTEFAVPDITMHFAGADVKLQRSNTFISVSDNVTCLAIVSYGDLSVYGNVAQANFLVGYDTEKKTVSFKPTDCSKN
ncbi:hypothetical protein V6N13_042526 [Hibiscus sabdariffa]|uniref:Peptidase A1 domain-containing protein n=1 Tax=Hibiscus sabdariffa TaxID=183260 RepID=A0ABR2G4G8_9ROSI